MRLVILSNDNPELAKAEARAVLKGGSCSDKGHCMLTTSRRDPSRLAYATHVMGVILESRKRDFLGMLERTRLKVRGSYSVRKLGKSDIPEGIVADIVYRRISNPRVDLKNPDTKLVYAEAAGSMYLGKLVWENDRRYLGRAPHLRPVLSPVSLPPKLARACVNLLGIRKGTVLDPFCGTGGILIEAALLGHRAVGYDIDPKMLLASKKNLDACNITGYSLFRRDALDLDQRHRYIVTDLPYGKNTGHLGNRLYPDFLKRLKKSNVRMAVVMFPASAEPARLLKKAGLSPAGVFSHYVHRSMTKEIVLIGNPWG